MRRIVRLVWTILTWTPIKSREGNAFNFLWTLGAIAAILLAIWTDGILYYDTFN